MALFGATGVESEGSNTPAVKVGTRSEHDMAALISKTRDTELVTIYLILYNDRYLNQKTRFPIVADYHLKIRWTIN